MQMDILIFLKPWYYFIMKNTGKCLCGAVGFTVAVCDTKSGACHCDMCRKWVGGPYMATNCGTDVTFTSEENITRYDSSDWGARGFCNKCGTSLFYYLKPKSEYHMPVGLFDNQDEFVFDHQIFIDEKPDYYDFANDTSKMTGAELFAEAMKE